MLDITPWSQGDAWILQATVSHGFHAFVAGSYWSWKTMRPTEAICEHCSEGAQLWCLRSGKCDIVFYTYWLLWMWNDLACFALQPWWPALVEFLGVSQEKLSLLSIRCKFVTPKSSINSPNVNTHLPWRWLWNTNHVMLESWCRFRIATGELLICRRHRRHATKPKDKWHTLKYSFICEGKVC